MPLKPTYTNPTIQRWEQKLNSMADTKKFPEGIRIFKPQPTAPDFIKGNITIDKLKLISWLDDQPNELRLVVKESGKTGNYYLEIDSYKSANKNPGFQQNKAAKEDELNDLPF